MELNASQYAHYVFKAFDHDGSGTINFQEFVLGLSTISRGSPTEKLQWTFNLYDINGDGCITREEMREIINSIYNLLGRFTEPCVSAEATRDHADRVFDKLDMNKDGIVTFDEFLETCLHDENITKSLSLLDTVL
ncbi:calsenilin [Nephila pilipes]|uniref:Calsenilin n=1 Tax=Nephila pilipes TaxID=299642 RepID=A0A8X6QZ10_NEPPI|nr:calsenilin [Nephila pilipes]